MASHDSYIQKLIRCTCVCYAFKMRVCHFNDGLQFTDMCLMTITRPDVREITAADVITSWTILRIVLTNPMSLVLYNRKYWRDKTIANSANKVLFQIYGIIYIHLLAHLPNLSPPNSLNSWFTNVLFYQCYIYMA